MNDEIEIWFDEEIGIDHVFNFSESSDDLGVIFAPI